MHIPLSEGGRAEREGERQVDSTLAGSHDPETTTRAQIKSHTKPAEPPRLVPHT